MFTYTLTDEAAKKTKVHADSRDVVKWERTSEEGEVYTDLIRDGRRSLTRHYRLAWVAARRQGVVDGDLALEVFEDRFVMDVKAEDTKVRPTKGEASPAT